MCVCDCWLISFLSFLFPFFFNNNNNETLRHPPSGRRSDRCFDVDAGRSFFFTTKHIVIGCRDDIPFFASMLIVDEINLDSNPGAIFATSCRATTFTSTSDPSTLLGSVTIATSSLCCLMATSDRGVDDGDGGGGGG